MYGDWIRVSDQLTEFVILLIFLTKHCSVNIIHNVLISNYSGRYDQGRVIQQIPEHRISDTFPLVQRRSCR